VTDAIRQIQHLLHPLSSGYLERVLADLSGYRAGEESPPGIRVGIEGYPRNLHPGYVYHSSRKVNDHADNTFRLVHLVHTYDGPEAESYEGKGG